jgi:hypothetical protein
MIIKEKNGIVELWCNRLTSLLIVAEKKYMINGYDVVEPVRERWSWKYFNFVFFCKLKKK